MKNAVVKKIEVVQLPGKENKINIFNRDIKYLKIKDVRRSYSRLIQDFCRGNVSGEDARTIAYLFSGYLQLVKDIEFEQRLNELEGKIGDGNEKF